MEKEKATANKILSVVNDGHIYSDFLLYDILMWLSDDVLKDFVEDMGYIEKYIENAK